jgi:hypothetical protein
LYDRLQRANLVLEFTKSLFDAAHFLLLTIERVNNVCHLRL